MPLGPSWMAQRPPDPNQMNPQMGPPSPQMMPPPQMGPSPMMPPPLGALARVIQQQRPQQNSGTFQGLTTGMLGSLVKAHPTSQAVHPSWSLHSKQKVYPNPSWSANKGEAR